METPTEIHNDRTGVRPGIFLGRRAQKSVSLLGCLCVLAGETFLRHFVSCYTTTKLTALPIVSVTTLRFRNTSLAPQAKYQDADPTAGLYEHSSMPPTGSRARPDGSHLLRIRGKRYPVSKLVWLALSVVLVCSCVTAQAEQVSLKNGDHLSGSIVSMDSKKLMLKTTYAGDVSIDWAEVSQFSSDKDTLVVTKADKQLVSGTVTSEGSDIVVVTAQGVQRVPRTDVATMRSPTDQAAY
jgi:hypothetical protein